MRTRYSLPPTPRPVGPRHELRTLRRLMPYLWPKNEPGLRGRVVASLLCLGGAKATAALIPLLYKHAIDLLGPGPHTTWAVGDFLLGTPLVLLLAYGGARIGQNLFNELQDLLFSRVTERAVRTVGLRAFRHLHSLSLSFHLDRQTGGVSRAIERGTRGIELMLRLVVFRTFPTLLELVIVCSILWVALDWRFAALTAATIVVYGLFTITVTQWRAKYRRAMNTSDADAGAKAVDSLLNYETVKFFNTEEHEARRYERALADYEKASLRSKASLSVLNLGQAFLITCGLVSVMVLAANGVEDGSLTVGDFVMVNSYLLQLAMPLNFLGMLYRELKQALIDMEILFSLLDEKPTIIDSPHARPLALDHAPEVRFDHVRFEYRSDRPILRDVSFTVQPGQRVAIVGPSGAGKSTLSRLLFRFWDVTGGSITVDGTDIRLLSQDSLRSAIGMVPQDCVLFNDTLAYNIAYGRPGASEDEIHQAARMAQLDTFINSLPDGTRTRVGERGLKLSGGEKQRVAVARTLLKAPPILILDEATSALDSRTEQDLQSALDHVAAHRTTLVIAHRLSTIVSADCILVLDQGRVVEQGTHETLLAQGGLYASLWNQQAHNDAEETASGYTR